MGEQVVAIIGRPNVGKSTLFNRLVGENRAVVDDTPGITRDRIYAEVEWRGRRFWLVDTAGLMEGIDDPLQVSIQRQVREAMAEADLILLVLDWRAGVLPADVDAARQVRRSGKPYLLVANKVDDFSQWQPGELFRLGLGEPLPVSAIHGLNSGDILDEILLKLPVQAGEAGEEETEVPRVALVGRPNVGKSSLLNRLLGVERVVVSDLPGTTRDAIDTRFSLGERNYVFIDTAGIRRQARVRGTVAYYGQLRSWRSILRANEVLLLLDATEGVTEQDKRIGGFIKEAGKGTILVVNKWDLVEKDSRTADAYRQEIYRQLYFLDYARCIFVSALTGQRVSNLLDLIDETYAQASHRIPTAELNRFLQEAVALQPTGEGPRQWKFFYGTQVGVLPPTFVLYGNNPEAVHFSYKRYLENKLREGYGFAGTPLRLIFRAKRGLKNPRLFKNEHGTKGDAGVTDRSSEIGGADARSLDRELALARSYEVPTSNLQRPTSAFSPDA
ncbi:MAG: ribosome biogenesis GTPase Der [Clostridia bacterium]|nr:MAG: ribosome biogenesis GTPase Der [Clostridia bacterium]